MARPLRFVIVSFVDDNFGDNLIRISFQSLLEVALGNHGLARDDYEIRPMALKAPDEALLESADAIFFAGGGLFGLSYLNFFPFMDQITQVAEKREVPVIFSSMGLNNMSAEGGSADAIGQVLRRSCVKAVSVRENLPLFEQLVSGQSYKVRQVADPAVWTRYIYGMQDVVPDGTLGINVVRGGLFADNDRKWGLGAEMKYLFEIKELADAAGTPAYFYTNGSLGDNNTLRYFAREYDIPDDRVILPQTTREVVEAISTRSQIAAIRMHSSIISYSFGIPTSVLEWNDKLPHFYSAVGHPERVIPFGEWTGERVFEVLGNAGAAPEFEPGYRDYLMTTYTYIHTAVGESILGSRSNASSAFEFDEVADALAARSSAIREDENDLRVKMGKAERAFLGRFVAGREKDAKIRQLTAREAKLAAQVDRLEAKVREQQRELDSILTRRVRRALRRRVGSLLRRLNLR